MGAGHRKLLQSGVAEALVPPPDTFSLEERKRPSGSSEKSSHIRFLFLSRTCLFFFPRH